MLSLKPYRRAAVPIVAVHTPDPAEVTRLALREATNGNTSPVLQWDCIHGILPLNIEAQDLCNNLNGNTDPAIATSNPIEALRALEALGRPDLDGKPIAIFYGLADVLSDPSAGTPARQALWNLRDVLSQSGTLLVLCVPIGWSNPFPDDIAIADMPLPTAQEHVNTAGALLKDAGLPGFNSDEQTAIGDALIGLSGFAAEQSIALSLTKQGIDIESLRERKRQQISETPGLSVYTGQERFADLGGLDNAKQLFGALLKGKRKPGAIVFIDEIEKALGNTSGDTSGTSQALLGYLLTYMQDQGATGSIFLGPPGAAKSAFAKAMGAEADIPTVALDLGGIKGSLVGESEGKMRTALSVVSAISGQRPFFVATCNSIASLPPELRRRFTVGTMFFDLPDTEERNIIWNIYCDKYGLDNSSLPNSDGWTGAEIKQCADLADRLGISLTEAAQFVVPVSVSARESISRLRTEASGRYLSASQAGVYQAAPQTGAAASNRKISLGD